MFVSLLAAASCSAALVNAPIRPQFIRATRCRPPICVETRVNKLFDSADINKDEKIDRTEAVTFYQAIKDATRKEILDQIGALDLPIPPTVDATFQDLSKGTGAITRDTLRAFLKSYGVTEGSDDIMKSYTGDTEGALGVREFAQLVSVLDTARAARKYGLKNETFTRSISTTADDESVRSRIGESAINIVSSWAKALITVDTSSREGGKRANKEAERVNIALRRMQRDMSMLDQAAGATPQLSDFELILLSGVVASSFFSPYVLTAKVVEVLVPSMSALAAAIGFSAEYAGKVAVSRGKEIAATTLQAAAEAELSLAQAERSKAIIPLCVGLSATLAAFALLAPALVGELVARGYGMQIATEVYLICPLFAVLAASVAALATQESGSLASRAIGVGARRFASSQDVGRTWLSATEQISASSERTKQKWSSFSIGVLPAPLLAVICPGPLSFKAIVAAAVAAAQCAYSLATAEYTLAAAVESVALKSRAAAVSDTYANQGARAGAILPFTSALSGLCAATTVAVVEVLPLVPSTIGESIVCVVFPAIGTRSHARTYVRFAFILTCAPLPSLLRTHRLAHRRSRLHLEGALRGRCGSRNRRRNAARRDLRRPYKPLEGDSRARPADDHRAIPAADCEEGALSDLLAASTHQVAAGQDKGQGRLAAEGDPFGGGVGVR